MHNHSDPCSHPACEPFDIREPALGHPFIAWLLILAFAGLAIVTQTQRRGATAEDTLGELQRNVLRIQGQYLVAAAHTPGMSRKQLYEGARPLDTGPLPQRLAFVVLAGELAGPAEALRHIDRIRVRLAGPGQPPPRPAAQVLEILQRLYTDYSRAQWHAPSVTPRERETLKRELGWFGALALAPRADPADRAVPRQGAAAARQAVLAPAWGTFLAIVLAMCALLAVGAAGLLGAITFAVLAFTRRITPRILPGSRHSAVYAETFAVWMLLLLAVSLAAAALPRMDENRLLYSGAASLLSLAALVWPVLRGVPWATVRLETGLTTGTSPQREAAWGIVCYVSTLPVVAVGFFTTLGLFQLQQWLSGMPDSFDPSAAPTHPIIGWVREAGLAGRLAVIVLACLIAPLVEETVFRGVLYRHLRDLTARWRTALSVAVAAVANSLLFAVIHPQGLLAAPVLMSIAFGLSLAREWRGSLLAPMVMHGLNNGVMLGLLFCLL